MNFILGWSRDCTSVTVAPFVGETGPAVPISSNPMELFSMFFDKEVVSHIITETYRYAQQCLANTSTMWHTTASEIRAHT